MNANFLYTYAFVCIRGKKGKESFSSLVYHAEWNHRTDQFRKLERRGRAVRGYIAMHRTQPDTPRPWLSIVIPAYNEAARIGETLEVIHAYLAAQAYSHEVLVVDDGSKDDTCEVAERSPFGDSLRIIRLSANQGKGAAVRRGMLDAKGAHRLFTDADNSTPIEELDQFWQWIEQGYGVCIGSRALPDSRVEVHQPFYREAMGRVFNRLTQALVLSGIQDTQCGFKLFTRDAAEAAFAGQRLSGFAFDVECILRARAAGFRIKEVPVRWLNSPISSVGLVRDSIFMLLELLQLRREFGKDGSKLRQAKAASTSQAADKGEKS